MKATAVDKAKRLDIYCRKDGSFERTLLVKNASDSSDFDFTGFTVEFFVVDAWFKTPRLSLIEGDGLTVTTGRIDIEISAADLNIKKEDLYYFMWVTSPDGSKYVWLNGRFVVNHQLFDGVTSTNELTINNTPDTINIIISADGSGEATMPTFDSGIELGEDNVARLGGTAKRNTTILGDGYDMIFGSTDSRFRNFFLRVADVFEVLIPSSGAWRAIVGTSQISVGLNALSFFNDNLIEFRRQDSTDIFSIDTTDGEEAVKSFVPVVLQNVANQAELDAIDPSLFPGALVFKGFADEYNIQQPLYSDGATWRSIRQLLYYEAIIGDQAANTGATPFGRLAVGENRSSIGYGYNFVMVTELLSSVNFTLSAICDFVSGDQTFLTITKNNIGKYILKVSVNLIDPDTGTWLVEGTIQGAGDSTAAGSAIVTGKNTSEFFDIFITGSCASANQFIRRYYYFEVKTTR